MSNKAPTSTIPTPQAPQRPFNPNQTRVTQITQATHTRHSVGSPQKSSSTSEVFVKVALLLVLAVGGWWGYKNYYLPSKNAKLAKNSKPEKSPGQRTEASVAEVTISFESAPSGAEIYVNGQNSGNKTPAVLTLTANKNYEIMLHKEGYLDYKITRSFAQTASITSTLQASVAMAYLNIQIADSGNFTKISINGKDLIEKPPIAKYPIIAERETVVRAYNPITQTNDEVKITAKPGEVMNIQLNLDRNKNQMRK